MTLLPRRHLAAGVEQAGDALEERGLSATRGPDHANELAVVHREGNVGDRVRGFLAGSVGLAQALISSTAPPPCSLRRRRTPATVPREDTTLDHDQKEVQEVPEKPDQDDRGLHGCELKVFFEINRTQPPPHSCSRSTR